MPQMAPYNWLYLNLMFTLIFIIFLSIMYFNNQFISPPKINNTNIIKFLMINKFNYKW